MSTEDHITIRVSIPLILAQVVRSRAELQDACSYVQRLLAGPAFLSCSYCKERFCFRLPVNEYEDDDDTDSWTVSYDPDATPSAAEAASLDTGDDSASVSFRGIVLISPIYKLKQKKCQNGEHRLAMADEISAVFARIQQFQLKASTFLYAPSSDSRMIVTIDHDQNDFPSEIFARVDQLLDRCARQYDFLTGCPDSGSAFDLFSFLNSSQPAVEEEVEERHPFDTAITFDQAPSTMSPTRIIAWIDILVKTVLRCSAADQTFFEWQLSEQGEFGAPEFTSTALLCALDVEPSTLELYLAKQPTVDEATMSKAMNAVVNRDPLGPLALHVANAEASRETSVSDRIKLKLLTGGYGMFPREYSRKALIAIGEEAAEAAHEEEEVREGVDVVFNTDPGRMSILAKKAKRMTCIW